MKNSNRPWSRADAIAIVLAKLPTGGEEEMVGLLQKYGFLELKKIIKAIPKILNRAQSDPKSEITKILCTLPANGEEAVANLIQSHSIAEINKIIFAINQILIHIYGLDEKTACELIHKAHSLNNELDKMRSRRGSRSNVSWQY